MFEISFELDGYEEAQKILLAHRRAHPNNPTIIRLQFEMAAKVCSTVKNCYFVTLIVI